MAFITPIYEDLKKINLPTKTPDFTVPEVLIHCTSTRTAKLWKNEYWAELLDWCQDNKIKIGLIGASEVQIDEYNLLIMRKDCYTNMVLMDLKF